LLTKNVYLLTEKVYQLTKEGIGKFNSSTVYGYIFDVNIRMIKDKIIYNWI